MQVSRDTARSHEEKYWHILPRLRSIPLRSSQASVLTERGLARAKEIPALRQNLPIKKKFGASECSIIHAAGRYGSDRRSLLEDVQNPKAHLWWYSR